MGRDFFQGGGGGGGGGGGVKVMLWGGGGGWIGGWPVILSLSEEGLKLIFA